jgi:hypothetical protein
MILWQYVKNYFVSDGHSHFSFENIEECIIEEGCLIFLDKEKDLVACFSKWENCLRCKSEDKPS